jgi:universal stress protein E
MCGAGMSIHNALLVVIDPTVEVQPALQKAAIFAQKSSHELILLGCVYDPYIAGDRFYDGPDLEHMRSKLLDERLDTLHAVADPLRHKGLRVNCKVVWDTPLHEAIVRAALEIQPDFVLKDAHHHSVLSRALFTNTDWHLIRQCPAPLWLVKQLPIPDQATVMAAVEPTHEHDEPAALDHKIIEQAQQLSVMFGNGLHLVHTFDMPTVAVVNPYAALPASASPRSGYERNVEQAERFHADAMAHLTKDLDCPADRIHLRQGHAAEMLPALAEELQAGIVVMGAVARSRLARAIIGSTAERALERIACDIVVVKPDGFVSPVDAHSDAQGFVEKIEQTNTRTGNSVQTGQSR